MSSIKIIMKFSLVASFISASALSVSAAPFTSQVLAAKVQDGSIKLPFSYPREIYKTDMPSVSLFARALSNPDSEEENVKAGLSFLSHELAVKPQEIKVTDSYMDDGKVVHVYVVRNIAGADVVNQRAAVHMRQGTVVAYSASFGESHASSFSAASPVTVPTNIISQDEAVKKGSAVVNGLQLNKDAPVHFQWVADENGDLVYCYVARFHNEEGSQSYELYIDAQTGQVVHSVDFVSHASYKVLPIPKISPRDGFEVVSNPSFDASSPLGWHNDGSNNYTTTRGNNADVTLPNNIRPESTGNLDFDTAWNETAEPYADANARAAAVNLFYLVNKMHDISYQFGFTEDAGNFQSKNKEGSKGFGGDAVQVSVQDVRDFNNAFFNTLPDGQAPQMQMFVFSQTKPMRDGALQNDVPIHEYTHGISRRMTGGGQSSTCLASGEPRALGEGWSDAVAMYLLRKESDTRDTDFGIGSYLYNSSKGLRTYPYSTNMQTNPLTYADLNSKRESHTIGEVWATMLNEMYWNLVDKSGFSKNWYDSTQKQGNIVALRLIFGGFANQPCNPRFIDARHAILLSDKLYYNSEHRCEIWKAFAKRGLGAKAVSISYTNSFEVPQNCQGVTSGAQPRARR